MGERSTSRPRLGTVGQPALPGLDTAGWPSARRSRGRLARSAQGLRTSPAPSREIEGHRRAPRRTPLVFVPRRWSRPHRSGRPLCSFGSPSAPPRRHIAAGISTWSNDRKAAGDSPRQTPSGYHAARRSSGAFASAGRRGTRSVRDICVWAARPTRFCPGPRAPRGRRCTLRNRLALSGLANCHGASAGRAVSTSTCLGRRPRAAAEVVASRMMLSARAGLFRSERRTARARLWATLSTPALQAAHHVRAQDRPRGSSAMSRAPIPHSLYTRDASRRPRAFESDLALPGEDRARGARGFRERGVDGSRLTSLGASPVGRRRRSRG